MPDLEKYYEYLKNAKADVPPTLDSFKKTLSDETSAKAYYSYLKENKFDAPDTYDSFADTLGLKKKAVSVSPLVSTEIQDPLNAPSALESGTSGSASTPLALQNPIPPAQTNQGFDQFANQLGKPIVAPAPVSITAGQKVEPLMSAAGTGVGVPLDQTQEVKSDNAGHLEGHDLKQALASGSSNLGASLLRTPAFLYDLAARPINYVANGGLKEDLQALPNRTPEMIAEDEKNNISSKDPNNALAGVFGTLEKGAKYYDKDVKEIHEEISQKYSGTIEDAIKKGDYTGAIAKTAMGVAESAPTTIALAMGNAAGLSTTGSIMGGGAVFGAGKKAALDESNPDMSEADKQNIAVLNGLTEGVFEQFGITKLGGIAKKVLSESGEEAARRVAKDGFKKIYAPIFAKYLGVPGAEAVSEAATTFAQNAIDKYGGANPDLDLKTGVIDSFVIGGHAALGPTVAMGALHASKTKKAVDRAHEIIEQRTALEQDLSSENTSPEAKPAVVEKIQQLNVEEANLHQQEKDNYEKLSPEDKQNVDALLIKSKKLVDGIADTNLSETSREVLKKDLEKHDKEVQSIYDKSEEAHKEAAKQEVADKKAHEDWMKSFEEAHIEKPADKNLITNLDQVVEKGSGRLTIQKEGKEVAFDKFDISIDKEAGTAEVANVEKKDATANKGIGYDSYIELGNRLAEQGIVLESMGQAQNPNGKALWDKLVKEGYAKRISQGRYQFTGKTETTTDTTPTTETTIDTKPIKNINDLKAGDVIYDSDGKKHTVTGVEDGMVSMSKEGALSAVRKSNLKKEDFFREIEKPVEKPIEKKVESKPIEKPIVDKTVEKTKPVENPVDKKTEDKIKELRKKQKAEATALDMNDPAFLDKVREVHDKYNAEIEKLQKPEKTKPNGKETQQTDKTEVLETEKPAKKAPAKQELIDEEEQADEKGKNDPGAIDKLNTDIEILKKFDKADIASKKFKAILERAWRMKDAKQITKSTYTQYRNIAQQVLGPKVNLDAEKAKFHIEQIKEEIKKRLLGEGYKKVIMSAPGFGPKQVADLIDLTALAAQKLVDAGYSIKEATAKALAHIKKHPNYSKLVSEGHLDEKQFTQDVTDSFSTIEEPALQEKPVTEKPVTKPEKKAGKETAEEAGITRNQGERRTAARFDNNARFDEISSTIEDSDYNLYDKIDQKKANEYLNKKLDEYQEANALEHLANEMLNDNSPFPTELDSKAKYYLADRLRVLAEKEGNEFTKNTINKLAGKLTAKLAKENTVLGQTLGLLSDINATLPLSVEGLKEFAREKMSGVQDTHLTEKQQASITPVTNEINSALELEEIGKAVEKAVEAELVRIATETNGQEWTTNAIAAIDNLRIDLSDC